MGADMQQLDKLKASEDARLAQMQAAINLEEVRGAQQAAADAQKAAAAATAQGWEGVGKVGGAVVKLAPLFSGGGGGGAAGAAGAAAAIEEGGTAERPAVTPSTVNIQQGGTATPWTNPLSQFPQPQDYGYVPNQYNPFQIASNPFG
jgi:hypothetical protein